MVKIRLGETGSFLHLRKAKVPASLRDGTKILFIGHSPPPTDQWLAKPTRGRNATVSQIIDLIKTDKFTKFKNNLDLMKLGHLWTANQESMVDLYLMNLSCVVAPSNRPRGDLAYRAMPDYQAEMEVAEAANRKALERAVRCRAFDLILIGWGTDTKSLQVEELDVLRMLSVLALERTMLVCGSDTNGVWNVRHPGAGRSGDGDKWTPYPAQPLADYLRLSNLMAAPISSGALGRSGV